MKASALVAFLNRLIEKHGDLDVAVEDAEYAAVDVVDDVKFHNVRENRWNASIVPDSVFLILG